MRNTNKEGIVNKKDNANMCLMEKTLSQMGLP